MGIHSRVATPEPEGEVVTRQNECFAFRPELLAEVDDDREVWETGPDGEDQLRMWRTKWIPFDFLEDGFLTEELNEHIVQIIDEDARRLNAERKAKQSKKAADDSDETESC